MRVVGIDPGTGSFDFFGMDGAGVIIDESVAVGDVAADPGILIETVRRLLPLDAIVGPSGYGLPVTPVSAMGERELDLMVPDDKSIPLYDGIRRVLRAMKEQGFPLWFTPGAIHLQTVPAYRKANKLDMGTADKVCCAALAVRDQADTLGIRPAETSFILLEMGFAFTAALAVERGRIVDGIGGSSGGPGFLTLGGMDAELASRLGEFPGTLLFTGGAHDMSRVPGMTPERLAAERETYADAWHLLVESAVKSVAALAVAVERPREILLTGRLTRIPDIAQTLSVRLARFGPVRTVHRRARRAKEAAEGAFVIGDGLLGGACAPVVEAMELRGASGTMYDHVLVKGMRR